MNAFDAIIALVELCFSSIWGLVGAVLGLLAAAGVWHVVDHQSRVPLAALTYVAVFGMCLIIGHKAEDKK